MDALSNGQGREGATTGLSSGEQWREQAEEGVTVRVMGLRECD